MTFPSDLEIARQAKLAPLTEIASSAGIPLDLLEPYGSGAAKIDLRAIDAMADRPRAKYVVVSAITPTPLGEGKTTVAVGLGQGFSHIGKQATLAIRQPSMGPTFGIKGGAAGGGYSQVVPMELLNLHLTGDVHAVTAATNMCAAAVDAHVFHGNASGLDPHQITWRRSIDVNDRSLRNVVTGLGSRLDGNPRETGFDITAASEVMATLALCTDLQDLRRRLGRIVVGYTTSGDPVTAEDVEVAGAMAVILREAIKPNLMQTLENTPVLVHAGPFGNIATGNSSIVADLIGIHMGDYLVTEAGFGADMGAERFFNIKCRVSGLAPDAAVLVATVRGLKAHSGKHHIVAGRPLPEALLAENPDEVHEGGANLRKQLENMRIHGCTPVVAINVFPGDHPADIAAIEEIAAEFGARSAVSTHFVDGGRRGEGTRCGRRRGGRGAERVRRALPRRDVAARQDPHGGHEGLRRGRGRLHAAGRTPDRQLRTQRVRRPAGVHRQDPPVDLVRPGAARRTDRLDASGSRGAGLGGRRVRLPDLRSDEHDAGPRRVAGTAAHRHRRRRQHRRPELTAPTWRQHRSTRCAHCARSCGIPSAGWTGTRQAWRRASTSRR